MSALLYVEVYENSLLDFTNCYNKTYWNIFLFNINIDTGLHDFNWIFQATFPSNFPWCETQHCRDEPGRDAQEDSDRGPGPSHKDLGHLGIALIDCAPECCGAAARLLMECDLIRYWQTIHSSVLLFTLRFKIFLVIFNLLKRGCIEYHLYKNIWDYDTR